MRLISANKLKKWAKQHPRAEEHLQVWRTTVQAADWRSMADVRKDRPDADPLDAECVIFDIRGNEFRMFCKIHFPKNPEHRGTVYTRWFGTHKKYDGLSAKDKARICQPGISRR